MLMKSLYIYFYNQLKKKDLIKTYNNKTLFIYNKNIYLKFLL